MVDERYFIRQPLSDAFQRIAGEDGFNALLESPRVGGQAVVAGQDFDHHDLNERPDVFRQIAECRDHRVNVVAQQLVPATGVFADDLGQNLEGFVDVATKAVELTHDSIEIAF
ncbi:hypothetical protein D9M71_689030 [compost metagenome]